MSKIVKLHFGGLGGVFGAGAVHMPDLCVACGSLAGPVHTMRVSGSTEHVSTNMSFPLCDSCHQVLTTAGAKPEIGYFKFSMSVPRASRAQYRRIRHAVRVKPTQNNLRFQFVNDRFGEAFEGLNAEQLAWSEKRQYQRRLSRKQPSER
ncbi:MAG: hypothetical protein ACXVJ7_12425 [Acidimicrobiia bacterium]